MKGHRMNDKQRIEELEKEVKALKRVIKVMEAEKRAYAIVSIGMRVELLKAYEERDMWHEKCEQLESVLYKARLNTIGDQAKITTLIGQANRD